MKTGQRPLFYSWCLGLATKIPTKKSKTEQIDKKSIKTNKFMSKYMHYCQKI